MRTIRVPPEIQEFASILSRSGWHCHLVGGVVRDSLLGRKVSDYDAATDARPEQVMACFRQVIPTGIKHGTVTVIYKGYHIETTTYRIEGGYSDARRPDTVTFASSIEDDLARRDFTINAMAFDPLDGTLLDLFGGRSDLERHIVRAVGIPLDRFTEDGLRPMRAVRFAAQLGFEIEVETFSAIRSTLERLTMVSMERIREEFSRIALSPSPSLGLSLMEKSGMLEALLPELVLCRGIEQIGMHRFDVLDHLFCSIDAARPDLVQRLAALFHDCGKPATMKLGIDGLPTFYRHEELSAEICEKILKRLRYPGSITKEVVHLIANHMFNYSPEWTDAAVRRFVAKVGEDRIEPLFELRLADGTGMSGVRTNPDSLMEFRSRIESVLEQDHAFSIKDLAIGGRELAELGVPKGHLMGRILAELLETVLEDPSQNTVQTLSSIAFRLYRKIKESSP